MAQVIGFCYPHGTWRLSSQLLTLPQPSPGQCRLLENEPTDGSLFILSLLVPLVLLPLNQEKKNQPIIRQNTLLIYPRVLLPENLHLQ